MSSSQAFKAGVGGREVAGLILGTIGIVVALLSPAIVSTVALAGIVAAVVLGIAAVTSPKGSRKTLGTWGIVLAVITVASAAAIFLIAVSAYAVLSFVPATLIGLAAISLGIRWLSRPKGQNKSLAMSALLLGVITVVMCMFGMARVGRAPKAPNPAVDSHREAVALSTGY